jgi:hypothetical protein
LTLLRKVRTVPGAGVEAEIDQAAFQRDQRLDGVVADINFRTKFPVKDAQARTVKRDGTRAGIAESLGEGLVEVVTHLALKLYFPIDLKN